MNISCVLITSFSLWRPPYKNQMAERSPVKEAFLAFLLDINMKSDDQRNDAVETYPEKPICTFLKAVGALVPDTTDSCIFLTICSSWWRHIEPSLPNLNWTTLNFCGCPIFLWVFQSLILILHCPSLIAYRRQSRIVYQTPRLRKVKYSKLFVLTNVSGADWLYKTVELIF